MVNKCCFNFNLVGVNVFCVICWFMLFCVFCLNVFVGYWIHINSVVYGSYSTLH